MAEHKTENLDLLKLVAYIEEQQPGTLITYENTQHDTGVAMDMVGRGLMRKAFKEAHRTYKIRKGTGWWLDCLENATEIVHGKTKRVYAGFVRVKQTIEIVRPLYYRQLPEEEQKLLDIQSAVTEAALAQSKQLSSYHPKRKQISQTTETIPLP